MKEMRERERLRLGHYTAPDEPCEYDEEPYEPYELEEEPDEHKDDNIR